MEIQKISNEILAVLHPVHLFHPVCLLVSWKFSTLYNYSILYLYLVIKSTLQISTAKLQLYYDKKDVLWILLWQLAVY